MRTQDPRLRTQDLTDPEAEIQEHGDWFADLICWLFTYAPALPLVVYCLAVLATFVIVAIKHFPR